MTPPERDIAELLGASLPAPEIFLSYSHRDVDEMDGLLATLSATGFHVWRDVHISAGTAWLDDILEHIEACHVFILVVSNASVRSEMCKSEVDYACKLGRPLLGITIGDFPQELLPKPLRDLQLVDYRRPTQEATLAVVNALNAYRTAPPPLPEPRPPRPEKPTSALSVVEARIDAEHLSQEDQGQIIDLLSQASSDSDEWGLLDALISRFRSRRDLFETTARRLPELDETVRRARARHSWDSSSANTDLLESLATQIAEGSCTPILGPGLTDSLLGPRSRLAQEWSLDHDFALSRQDASELSTVAQFVRVMRDERTMYRSLMAVMNRKLRGGLHMPVGVTTNKLLVETWLENSSKVPDDPYVVLAQLPCSIYVTAQQHSLLAAALSEAGRSPLSECCRWRSDDKDWPKTDFDLRSDYEPSMAEPLVYHLFGHLDKSESLVLTEDDHFDFLVGITENRDRIPHRVRRALVDSGLLFLGFDLEARDIRVLLRALVHQEGSPNLRRHSHVAVQLDVSESATSRARARRYLEKYFGELDAAAIGIFWGSAAEFAAGLRKVLAAES